MRAVNSNTQSRFFNRNYKTKTKPTHEPASVQNTIGHVPFRDLVFETEQAYRFVRRITDAGAAITFATTTDNGVQDAGHMMFDEMQIMEEINNRLLGGVVPDYEPYERPEGAFLLGE